MGQRLVRLADLRAYGDGAFYPSHLIKRGDSALCCFAAAFIGKQDAVWLHQAGVNMATCLDSDADALDRMKTIYPSHWEFVCADVFDWTAATSRTWDVLSLDPPTNLFQITADHIERWCTLAREAVILGIGKDTELISPAGWHVVSVRKRSSFMGGTYWAALQVQP